MLDNFFKTMCSNTLAGSTNQTYFCPEDENKEYTGRVFYKVFAGGEYQYSFLFSGVTDSDIPVMSATPANYEIIGWTIVSARVGISKTCNCNEMPDVYGFQQLYFNGNAQKHVNSKDFFCSDEITLDAKGNEYICLEITYKGKQVPYHYENLVPAFVKEGDKWVFNNHAVFSQMVGCNRKVKRKIAFIGDSITHGIGTDCNSYAQWNALVGTMLGHDYSYWNLGIGYGMANDAASDKSWLYKAKQNDIVFVCFGVNDIFRVRDYETTKNDLTYIVKALKDAGCTVVLQTIPPFDYNEEDVILWQKLNDYLEKELKNKVDLFYDNRPVLQNEKPGSSKYGAHPDAVGCEKWAIAFLPEIKKLLETL